MEGSPNTAIVNFSNFSNIPTQTLGGGLRVAKVGLEKLEKLEKLAIAVFGGQRGQGLLEKLEISLFRGPALLARSGSTDISNIPCYPHKAHMGSSDGKR